MNSNDNGKSDFILECKANETNDYQDYQCELYAVSEIAKQKFGPKRLGGINISIEPDVLQALNLPENTMIIDFVFRDKNNKELSGIGLSMICSLSKQLNIRSRIQYIYLESINNKLTEYYKSIGFKIISNKGMIVDINKLENKCFRDRIPIIFNL